MSGSESGIDLSMQVKSTDSSANSTPKKEQSKVSSSSSPSSPSTNSMRKPAAVSMKDISKTETKESEIQNLQNAENAEFQHVTFVHKGDTEIRQEATLPMNTTVKSVKAELATFLKMQKRNIRLVKNGKKMHNRDIITCCPKYKFKQEQMSTTVVSPSSGTEEIVIEIGLDDSDSESEEEIHESSAEQSKITIITVNDAVKLEEVAVVKTMDSRQYLGGYRNKKTRKVYYHAASQTEHKNAKLFSSRVHSVGLYTRETQTLLPLVDEGINTASEKCTQMVQSEVYIPTITDKILTARPYQAYEEKNKLMTPEAAARILQKAWKLFIRKKQLHDSYKSQAEEREAKQQYKGSSLAEFHKLQLSLFTKDCFPSTRGDFYDLYNKVGEWKSHQVEELKELKSGFAYKVALADVQKKELEGLLAIEEQRIRARDENLSHQDIMFLEGTARSRVRKYPKGNVTIVDDLNIQRARNFKEQFASYMRKDVTKTERIEILSCMKNFLAGFDAVDLTGDLIELIDREIDMINMEIEDKHLSILKKRFESLFINLAKNPEFNPQAKYYKGSMESAKKYAKYKCVSCGKIMYPSHMFMHLRMSRFRSCMSCAYMHTTAAATTNLAPYKRILMTLRTAEQEKGCR